MLLFLFSAVGLTFAVNFASILDPVKARLPQRVVDVLNCPQCVGFWAGIVVGTVVGPAPSVPFVVRLVLCGLASSAAAVFGARLLND